ncbi:uncharacterized protein LOC120133619 [Hibiscus syriacus]|uniref:uncharacterized protein LOC120133619 n=1 Tax=Hibiscus syriacus TaxID=106335 RepID=UPI001921FFD6|nr:uncharacterized protein LOC120133619 [Hibiscus syriacus]
MILQEESQHSQLFVLVAPSSIVLFSNSVGTFDHRHFTGSCDFFKIRGHKKEQCYCLIGFPPGYKFTKKKGDVANSSVFLESEDTSKSLGASPIAPTFTTEHYNQILLLLNKSPSVDSAANLVGSLHWKDEGDW